MKKNYSVGKTFEGMRFDRWIRNNIGNLPQGLIEKYIRKGVFKLNKKKTKSSQKLKLDDVIQIYEFKFKKNEVYKKNKFIPSNNIIKENENLIIDDNEDFIVINKSSGISVQGGTKSRKNLIDIFARSKFFKDAKPFSVHRLDKDTSGVFMIAKNRETAQLLTSLFRLRKIHKTYIAICYGELPNNSGKWFSNLTRYENNKTIVEKAITNYKVLDKNSEFSLVKMNPITGRKHQLRKQLFEIGHPILGDKKYKLENNNIKINKNLFLHSFQIKFMIKNKKYKYTALLPDYFNKLIKSKKFRFLDF